MKIVQPSVSLEWHTADPMGVIMRAGATCYKSEPPDAEAFVRKIIKSGHTSVLEHAVASFRVVCDRGVSHEFVRHRIASYSQESTRYCNYSANKFGSEIQVLQPPGLDDTGITLWRLCCAEAERTYLALLARGVPAQIARSVLPNSLKTELVATLNFRSWRNFIHLRCAKTAHPQMQQIANYIRLMLLDIASPCFEDVS